MKNLNLLFHKIYYDKIGTDDFKNAVEESNRNILGSVFVHANDFQKCELPDVLSIRLKTKYPGLLVGVGYPHNSGRADDDIRVGFSFDYVSGQPYIPGSTVKGVLRSCFKNHPEAISEIASISIKAVREIEANIFDCGDIFLDAVLYDGAAGNLILGKDYITPHDDDDSTKNPIPIHIIKILPDVRFEFRFVVSDFVKNDFTFTQKQKLELFKTLLELFGIGAKTNVGFGALEHDDSAPRALEATTGYGHQSENSGAASQEKVKCPHCGFLNYKYNKKGEKNKRCYNYNCGKNLP